ncbi:LrgB family protein [Bordetella pertussis]|nr:LrgB family protein [Bordetella pertussis]UEA96106.1 LrgB family protein [Bordetella pertussis]UEB60109.1 LrgB family protein [Bordetella pertussis]URM49938.1 LrgB family protein [Bordetella pertussis CS]WAZ31277.1 LrgB family protein [Bordetella pertussis]WAZ34882.1 LrgB family protein [Bordetella pertussis]
MYLSSTPLFGLTATLTVYLSAHAMYLRLGQVPLANPVLWSMVVLAAGLLAFGVPYPTYFGGAQFIHFLLGPAVVALAWPLWMRRAELRRRWARLLWAALFGGAVACASAVLLGWAVGLPRDIILSLAPKSVTAPVAMGLSETLGGIPALSAVFAALTGLVGALTGKYLFDLLGPVRGRQDWADRGFALGTVSHGIGAARAIQVNADAGAYAGLALGLQVILASLLIPVAFRLAAGLGGS